MKDIKDRIKKIISGIHDDAPFPSDAAKAAVSTVVRSRAGGGVFISHQKKEMYFELIATQLMEGDRAIKEVLMSSGDPFSAIFFALRDTRGKQSDQDRAQSILEYLQGKKT